MHFADRSFDFFDDATSREMSGGSDSPLGASDVCVIPSPARVRPAGIVLALSRRARRGTSLAQILTQTNALLTAAAAPPQAVVLLSDTWDADLFAKVALSGFREHHARGVQFILLLVGAPQQVVSPMPVLLNGRPIESDHEPVRVIG